jgi:hypothetical protein
LNWKFVFIHINEHEKRIGEEEDDDHDDDDHDDDDQNEDGMKSDHFWDSISWYNVVCFSKLWFLITPEIKRCEY